MEHWLQQLEPLLRDGSLWLRDTITAGWDNAVNWITANLFSGSFMEWSATVGASFAVIVAAEMGDKSQIVCMTLAARHRGWPVLFGALVAFAVLNLMAVLFGALVATWVPKPLLAALVAVVFALFGLHALRAHEKEEEGAVSEKSGHGIFIATFLLIFIAEFGDKTQIAIAGLSCCALPGAVWVGSTLALGATSGLGVLAGRTLLQRIPVTLVHRISGGIFLLLAGFAAYLALTTSGWGG